MSFAQSQPSTVFLASAVALAIVFVTLLVRAARVLLGRSQVRAEFTRIRLAPKLQTVYALFIFGALLAIIGTTAWTLVARVILRRILVPR